MLTLDAHLKHNLAHLTAVKTWYVGFSGGLDSCVLLHLMAANFADKTKVKAIHIQHNLQPNCAAWSEHCRNVCRKLNLEIKVISLNLKADANIEEKARQARYAAFALVLQKNDVLLLAHHLQDQSETVLLRLLRGSGILGLSAIKMQRPLAAGQIMRPLLNIPQSELRQYALAHNLSFIDDPSNSDIKFTRNFIRHQILPQLQQTWPNVNLVLARTASHASEAQTLLDELAAQDLAQIQANSPLKWLKLPCLEVKALQQLSFKRQKNVMRYFLRNLTLLPDAAHWHGFLCLLNAPNDAKAIWQLGGGKLVRSKQQIWWLPNDWSNFAPLNLTWDNPSKALNLDQNGLVQISGKLDFVAKNWQIKYRTGGERIWHPKFGTIGLKRYLNAANVPYFVRPRLPLLYADNVLIACANIANNHQNWQLIWHMPAV